VVPVSGFRRPKARVFGFPQEEPMMPAPVEVPGV
jgi:hypothetical protein